MIQKKLQPPLLIKLAASSNRKLGQAMPDHTVRHEVHKR
jgi:hypothetical protein